MSYWTCTRRFAGPCRHENVANSFSVFRLTVAGPAMAGRRSWSDRRCRAARRPPGARARPCRGRRRAAGACRTRPQPTSRRSWPGREGVRYAASRVAAHPGERLGGSRGDQPGEDLERGERGDDPAGRRGTRARRPARRRCRSRRPAGPASPTAELHRARQERRNTRDELWAKVDLLVVAVAAGAGAEKGVRDSQDGRAQRVSHRAAVAPTHPQVAAQVAQARVARAPAGAGAGAPGAGAGAGAPGGVAPAVEPS